MRHLIIYALQLFAASVVWASPEALTTYFQTNGEYVRASYGTVQPPKEIQPYLVKMRHGITKNAEWFKKYSESTLSNGPLPYNQKLGVTEEEYQQYLALWKQRAFKELKKVDLKLEKRENGTWRIRATGPGFPVQALEFSSDFSTIKSPNGQLKRADDIKSAEATLLREWSGAQWVLESKEVISTTVENFAIGKQKNQVAGYLLYRLQEISSTGRKLYDNQILIQFPLKK